MQREVVKATLTATGVTLALVLGIVVGSRNLEHFDAALVGYTFATVAAAFGIAYRYSMWLQRPPTNVYWHRGWQLFFQPSRLPANIFFLIRRLITRIFLNSFIWRRNVLRGGAHWLIMWGCLIAAAITFPLVFGWLYFISPPEDPHSYQIIAFGFPVQTMKAESLMAELIFHGLVFASFFVTVGVMLAMRRRMRDRDVASTQTFEEDILPLLMLFSISVTGLMLTVSYTWLRGYGYDFLAGIHAITVIMTLIWLPFGKFFHIFQRPAQLGVDLYRHIGNTDEQAHCARCGESFTSLMHVQDLIEVQKRLGYQYELAGQGRASHYQEICPRCRRHMLGIAQGRLWSGRFWQHGIEESEQRN